MKYFTKNLWFYEQLLLLVDKFPTPALVRFLGVHQDEEVWGIWASGGNWSYGQHGWWGNSILKCTQEPSALLYRYHIGNLECFHLIILKISKWKDDFHLYNWRRVEWRCFCCSLGIFVEQSLVTYIINHWHCLIGSLLIIVVQWAVKMQPSNYDGDDD